jgi:integrase
MTKDDDQRKVPLSPYAIDLMHSFLKTDVRVTSGVASTIFRKARDATEIKNLNFHDTRHEAITRLAKRLYVWALARIVGHRDIRSLMIYYK